MNTNAPSVNRPALRILIAEDNEDLRQILEYLISSFGMQTQIAVNGQQAFEIICSKKPDYFDAILSDIDMPLMNGFELLTQLQKNNFRQPFIFMTAAATIENTKRALELGIKYILEKPFEVETLKDCLKKALQIDLLG